MIEMISGKAFERNQQNKGFLSQFENKEKFWIDDIETQLKDAGMTLEQLAGYCQVINRKAVGIFNEETQSLFSLMVHPANSINK